MLNNMQEISSVEIQQLQKCLNIAADTLDSGLGVLDDGIVVMNGLYGPIGTLNHLLPDLEDCAVKILNAASIGDSWIDGNNRIWLLPRLCGFRITSYSLKNKINDVIENILTLVVEDSRWLNLVNLLRSIQFGKMSNYCLSVAYTASCKLINENGKLINENSRICDCIFKLWIGSIILDLDRNIKEKG